MLFWRIPRFVVAQRMYYAVSSFGSQRSCIAMASASRLVQSALLAGLALAAAGLALAHPAAATCGLRSAISERTSSSGWVGVHPHSHRITKMVHCNYHDLHSAECAGGQWYGVDRPRASDLHGPAG